VCGKAVKNFVKQRVCRGVKKRRLPSGVVSDHLKGKTRDKGPYAGAPHKKGDSDCHVERKEGKEEGGQGEYSLLACNARIETRAKKQAG